MEYLFIALIILIIGAIVFLRTPAGKGWYGELVVKLVIGRTKPGVRYVINDLIIHTGEGKTAQIDHIVINRNGIFVIETKNYSGRIYGDESCLEWTQVLNYGRVKNKLYNPIRQNKSHIYHISQIIGKNVPIVSAVVLIKGNIRFINASGVYSVMGLHKLVNTPHCVLNDQEMQEFYTAISAARDESVSTREHVENIRAMQRDVQNNICPRCGKKLVLRQGRSGEFYGCSGYPECKFTKGLGFRF